MIVRMIIMIMFFDREYEIKNYLRLWNKKRVLCVLWRNIRRRLYGVCQESEFFPFHKNRQVVA